MRSKLVALALGVLLTMPCALHAEEVVIQLMEVIAMSPIPGDDPLDGPTQSPNIPPTPNDFIATINGDALSVTKLSQTIPVANALVVKVATGGIVLNRQFTSSVEEQITDNGMYVLRIETEAGALVGQFMVQ